MKTTKTLMIASVATLIFSAQAAFSVDSDCKNPRFLFLTKGKTAGPKIKFCEIPAAQNVLIGSENGKSNEKPVKARKFNKFHIGKYEVTQLQYKLVLGREPWKGKDFVQEADENPAVYVNYNEAKLFARVLSEADPDATYRLPTEAEWEYAARGIKNRNAEYYWGNKFDSIFAYSLGNSDEEYAKAVTSCPIPLLEALSPEYCANDFGLMHMLGNVAEWTSDAYENSHKNASTDGHVAVKGDKDSKYVKYLKYVIRGGNWEPVASDLRSAYRLFWGPGNRSGNVGFRLVRISK